MSRQEIVEAFDKLQTMLSERLVKTRATYRSKTQDRVDYCIAQLSDIKALWNAGHCLPASARLEELSGGNAFGRSWRALRGENLAQFAVEKARAQTDFDTLVDAIYCTANAIESEKAAAAAARQQQQQQQQQQLQSESLSLGVPGGGASAGTTNDK